MTPVGLNFDLHPRGPHKTQKTGSIKRECVSESLSFKICHVIRNIMGHNRHIHTLCESSLEEAKAVANPLVE